MLIDLSIKCPKCGEPPRFVLVQKGYVRCIIEKDGSIGPVVSFSREKNIGNISYECGGKHIWTLNKEISND